MVASPTLQAHTRFKGWVYKVFDKTCTLATSTSCWARKVKWTGTSTLSCFSIVLTHNANSAAPWLQLKGIWFNMEHTLIQKHSQSPLKRIQELPFWLSTPSTPVLLSELGTSQADQDFSFVAVPEDFQNFKGSKIYGCSYWHTALCACINTCLCAHKHPLDTLLYPENQI